MNTVTSSAPAAMDAFVEGMLARENVATWKLQVSSGYLGEDSSQKESIQLTHVSNANQEWGALGNRRREEEYTIHGFAWALAAGKNEPAIKAARDRAFELLAEVEDFLRLDPTIGNTVKVAHLTAFPFDQNANVNGRYCQIDFEITCEKSLRSS